MFLGDEDVFSSDCICFSLLLFIAKEQFVLSLKYLVALIFSNVQVI